MSFESIKKELELLASHCIRNKISVAVAESVTSGLIQTAFSLATDARLFFQGGLTAYNLGIKTKLLNVEPISAELNNCVSADVSRNMAHNVKLNFLADVGMGITGYASSVPELGIKRAQAFLCISRGEFICEKHIQGSGEDAYANQLFFATEAVKELYLFFLQAK